jgi:hypothetical protein
MALSSEIIDLDEKEEDSETIKEEKTPEVPAKVSYRPVLFISDEVLEGEAETTFRNIVANALKLNEADYSFLLQDDIPFDSLNEVNSVKVILFGVAFSGYQTKYKLESESGKLVLFSDSLKKITQDRDLKLQLWAQLQLMFPKL